MRESPHRYLYSLRATLLLWGLAAGLHGEEYSHRVWRTEDGLPQNRIQVIGQTSDGYLWIGTSEGLARFDGLRFVVFDRSNTPAFTDSSILSLEPAPDGSLWIGVEGGGLLHYAEGAFRSYGQKDGLTNSFVRAIHLDRGGGLWVGTDRGFFRFTGSRFTRLDGTREIPLASVLSMAEDPSGKIWVASFGGLLVMDRVGLAKARCPGRATPPLQAIALLRAGLIEDGCGVPPIVLPNLAISALRSDAAGNLWIGTAGQGLIRLNSGVSTVYKAPAILPDNAVSAIFEDRQHNIWVGAQDGLLRLSRTAVTILSAREGLADDNISTTYEDREGTLWFGTSGGGVVRLSGRAAIQYTKNEGLRSNTIRQIHEDPRGTIWIATDSGLSRWDGHAFTNYYLEDGLSYPSVRCLATDANGDILAGTDAGLNRIHDGRIVPDPSFAGMKQERIWSIHADIAGLWLGTRGGGLVRLRNGKLTRFTARDGLISNSIYQILDDQAGKLWMSSPGGVFSVSRDEIDRVANGVPAAIHVSAYGTSDGMETSQMFGGTQPAGWRTSRGDLWFPSVRGAVKIDPNRIPQSGPAAALIERVVADDTVLPASREIAIRPGRGKLQVDFTAIDLAGPQRVSFSYKLEGFDDAWTLASKPRSALYSSLPPGHYRFRVVAANAATPSASSEASVAIYLKPAFHQTGWFYVMWAVIILCAGWSGMLIYTRQTRARFALLLSERTRLAREMHDTVIQGCVGLSALLEAAVGFQRSNLPGAAQLLDEARSQVKATLEEARQAVWDLRHSTGEGSAISVLFELAQKLGREYAVSVVTEVQGARIPLDPVTDRALLLVGREALRNSVTHAKPSRIFLRIVFESKLVRMEVCDDGGGFDAASAFFESGKHFGIVGMRERIEQLGGRFELHSRAGEGTTIAASLPARTEVRTAGWDA